MSKYTTELRFICESESGLVESVGYDNVDSVIAAAIPKIFSFDFPMFDEAYRGVLCGKIIKHYYTREIGAETYGRWKLFLDTRMNEIMPYYNKMYESAAIEFDPLVDTDIVTNHGGTIDNTGTVGRTAKNIRIDNLSRMDDGYSNTVSANNSHTHYSDTPQGRLTNVENGEYLTTATYNGENNTVNNQFHSLTNDTGSQENNENVNESRNLLTTDNYLHTVKGKSGGKSYSKLLTEYRKSLINIDAMIIDELADLFINIY